MQQRKKSVFSKLFCFGRKIQHPNQTGQRCCVYSIFQAVKQWIPAFAGMTAGAGEA
jgi:hypothetical protein